MITLVRLKETLIENTRLPGQIAVAAMAHSRRRTEEEWKQRTERKNRERQRRVEKCGFSDEKGVVPRHETNVI